MKITALIFSFFLYLSGLAQPNPQPKKMTEKFFPDPEIAITTPAFQKKKGFTSYEEMMAYLNKIQASHIDEMSISFIGKSQKGAEIPLISIKRQGGENDKVKVWMQGGLHGNEPASTEGILYFIDRFFTEEKYNGYLDKIEFAIVPMANIDGYEKQDRYAANGLDLNRDQTKLMAPESVVLKKAFSDFNADVALDFHEYRPFRRDFTKMSTYGVTQQFDVMFLYSGNLNVPEKLRNYTKDKFVKNAVEVLSANNLTHHDYISSTRRFGELWFNQGSVNARSSASSYALSSAISSLIEVRGVGIGRTSFTRRVYSTFLIASSYVQTTYEHLDEIKELMKDVRMNPPKDAVVNSKRKDSESKLEMIDVDTNEKIEIDINLAESWYSSPTLSRERPFAYLILPGNTEIIDRLNTLGISTTPLQPSKEIEVQRYVINDYQLAPEEYEGVYRQDVSVDTEAITKTFPEGTSILYMDQQRAGLAVEVLEPEAANSFVSFSVIETEKGAELPIYRYLIKEKL